jgi:tRNA(fMet)-specific endonuclease VapC
VIGAMDMLIAAIALANGLILVTHNTKEFARIPGLQLEDWILPNSS